MKKLVCLSVGLLIASSAFAADPKEEVVNAAKKLGEQSYSWKSSVNSAVQSRFRQGPTEGKAEKGGYTMLTMSFGDNTIEAVLKDGKGAIKTQNGWQSMTEAAESTEQQNTARFLSRFLMNLKAPAEQALDLANKNYGIRKSDDAYVADLNQEAIKQLLTFGRRGGAGNNTPEPEMRDTAGTVKFWVKDGVLTKYEYAVKGIVTFGGNERTIDRTTTVEIKDVGSTKVEVPEEAKQKAS